ncbi:DUF3097 family protein [Rothia aerolata]|uniref:DUF3097 domain-containing protein n=1 Tax=Rothia aerolata TaxID=1812262 RepID=A0A917MQ99_9MICC|nr:DUF3097 family protein [Rothia aerolata]GGH57631.1 hypothetical protein GCM10007359_02970 [Rothia aerolata]
MSDSYSSWGAQDLSALTSRSKPKALREVPVQPGLLLEDVQSGWVGVVVSLETIGGMRVIRLEDSRGKVKTFPLGFGFLLEGEPVKVVAPVRKPAPAKKLISRSGSRVVQDAAARVALPSRLWVEGTHDAELVEKVWGHDLRVEGIVVEPLHGVDDLASAVTSFAPTRKRRLGILVDHLKAGTKESRIVAEALAVPGAAGNVQIVGHPYVDVWQAVKPRTLGIDAWPEIPRGQEWKKGILKAFGWPHRDQADVAAGWQRILSAVNSYADLEPSILGPVEQLIDFLTEPE